MLAAYTVTLFIPTVLVNSGMWGQCDSIYTSFVLLSLLFLIKKKYVPTFIMLGLAFAFKLQTIFILPLYVILYFTKRGFSVFHVLLAPLTYIVMSLPAVFFGMPASKMITVYLGQMSSNKILAFNFPSIYNIGGDLYQELYGIVGMIMALTLCFIILIYLVRKKIEWNNQKIMALALLFLIMLPFILPHMHERYLYVAEVMMVIYYILYRKGLPMLLFLLGSAMITYTAYFSNGGGVNNMQLISIVYGVVLAYFAKDVMTLLVGKRNIQRKIKPEASVN